MTKSSSGPASLRHAAGSVWQRSRKQWHPTWRWGHNLIPTVRHLRHPAPLGEAGRSAVQQVRRTGFATSALDVLANEPGLFDRLRAAIDDLEAAQADQIAGIRASLARVPGDAGDVEKVFLHQPLGDPVHLDLSSPYAEVARRLAPLADAYFGMQTQVRAYGVWHNLASSRPPTDSQLWHRDREDLQILKVFVYLDDVGSGNGPFWYAPGTHHLGTIHEAPAAVRVRGVLRSTDDQMRLVVPPERWIEATGAAGTTVLADTHGYHKGGHAVSGDRRLFMVLYTSQDSGVREWFDRSGVVQPSDPVERFLWSRG